MNDIILQSISLAMFFAISVELIIPSQTARLFRVSSGRPFYPPYWRHSTREALQKVPAYALVGYLSYRAACDFDGWIMPLVAVFVIMASLNVYLRVIRQMISDIRLAIQEGASQNNAR